MTNQVVAFRSYKQIFLSSKQEMPSSSYRYPSRSMSAASDLKSIGLSGRGPKGQHSAPRGGPPRAWTNDDLTKALQHVWNKRMTTSQASRFFGIPYNSLLMYVRGKYGKSLKLDALKKTTPAANDNLNTIGNSRSTPKEKLAHEKARMKENVLKSGRDGTAAVALDPYAAALQQQQQLRMQTQQQQLRMRTQEQQHQEQQAPRPPSHNVDSIIQPSFRSPLFHHLPAIQERMGGLLGMLPPQDGSRVRELMQNIHREQQSALARVVRQEEEEDDGVAENLDGHEEGLAKQQGNAVDGAVRATSPPGVGGLLMVPSSNVVGHHSANSLSSDALSRSPVTSDQSIGSGSVAGEDDDDHPHHNEDEDEDDQDDGDYNHEAYDDKERPEESLKAEAECNENLDLTKKDKVDASTPVETFPHSQEHGEPKAKADVVQEEKHEKSAGNAVEETDARKAALASVRHMSQDGELPAL